MKNENVYLTFKTDRETSWHLKTLAKMLGKTQPEFINEICQNYVKAIITEMEKDIEKAKNENAI